MKNKTTTTEKVLSAILATKSNYIIGIDEVGLGAWAGPLAVAGAVMPKGWGDPDVRDSKRVKPHAKRNRVFQTKIVPAAKYWTVHETGNDVIDKDGVRNVLRRLIQQIIDECMARVNGDALVVLDGVEHGFTPIGSVISLPKADQLVPAVSAASIIAKVKRDTTMFEFDKKHPGYDFKKNVGYGTKKHMKGLATLGVCEIHRTSYRPIKDIIAPPSVA